jgi:hypothetical protein
MSDKQALAMIVLFLAAVLLAGAFAPSFAGWRRIAFFIAAAICAAPAVFALFVTAVAG